MQVQDLKNFTAGAQRLQGGGSSFIPSKVNVQWTWSDPKINTLLAEANRKLGELNAYSTRVPDVDYFIAMHVLKEATTSSRIEGTETGIEDALLAKSEIDPEKRDDWQEVRNYTLAMNQAVATLRKLPVSTRLIKETHKTLLSKGRGVQKSPGEYRRSQNWIGGSSPRDAAFVPPPHEEVNDLMGDLEKFLHNEKIDVPHLIRIGIAHYQFETIHPFLDGNGRIGRLLITLYLVSKGLLSRPTLYLSDYFERHRADYYDHLSQVRTTNDLVRWVKLFLTAVIETSTKGVDTFDAILSLKDRIEDRLLPRLGARQAKGKKLLLHLFKKPHISASEVAKALDITPATANSLIGDFVAQKILVEVTGWKRNRRYIFWDYVHLFVR